MTDESARRGYAEFKSSAYGRDPDDRHIRIASTFPSLHDITPAARGIALSLRVAISE